MAFCLVAATPAIAQDFQQVAPKPVPQDNAPPPAVVAPPPAVPIAGQDNQEVLPELKGLVLVDSAERIRKNGIGLTGVSIIGLPFLDTPELRAQLTPFFDKPATFGDLRKVAQIITAWYASHNRPFVDVIFPAQDIDAGVVQAVVTEFHLGAVKVEGNVWFSSELLHSYVRAVPGQPIDSQSLNEDIAVLNQNPFRRVAVVAEKSTTPGATDLVLKTEDRLPLRAYVGYDNTGTEVLGYNRWNLGLNWGSVFGTDQQLSYQLTTSDNFWSDPGHAAFVAHSVNYLAPLPWRDKIAVFGSYSQARPELGPDLGLIGISGQASARYMTTLPTIKSPFGDISEDLQAGYDFKTSNNDLSFGGVEVSNVTTEVNQFPIIYDAGLTTALGLTNLTNTFVWSPGSLTSQNRSALFQAQANTPFAAADYIYDTLQLTQTARLPFDLAWVTKFSGQLADHNLLPSEQLGAGGHDSVRGYDERSANGSEGILLSEELRSPSYSLVGPLLDANPDQVQFLAFWDYATVRDHQVTPGTPASIQLASIGGGMRYTLSRFVDLRLDYGHQLLKLPGAARLGQVAHIAVTIGY